LVVALQRITIISTKQAEHISLVKAAMKSLSVPKNLGERILQYHQYVGLHHNEEAYSSLLDGLSENLSIELKLFMFRKLLRSAPFFQDIPRTALHELVLCFKEQVYSPGDVIIRKGAIGKEMFFIVKGTVEVLGDKGVLFMEKVSGDYFGEVALVRKDAVRTAWIRAKSYCILAALTKVKMQEALETNPALLHKLEERIRAYTAPKAPAPPPPPAGAENLPVPPATSTEAKRITFWTPAQDGTSAAHSEKTRNSVAIADGDHPNGKSVAHDGKMTNSPPVSSDRTMSFTHDSKDTVESELTNYGAIAPLSTRSLPDEDVKGVLQWIDDTKALDELMDKV
jgi:hypothetical protein